MNETEFSKSHYEFLFKYYNTYVDYPPKTTETKVQDDMRASLISLMEKVEALEKELEDKNQKLALYESIKLF